MKVEVASTNGRQFVESLLKLGKMGGYITDECPVFKGLVMRTQVIMPEGAEIVESPIVRIMPGQTVEPTIEVVAPVLNDSGVYTKDQLEEMSLAEVRKATGIKEGGKQEIIAKYLESLEEYK